MLQFSYAQKTPKEIDQDLQQLNKIMQREDNYLDSAYAFIQKRLRIDTTWLLRQSDVRRINQAVANQAIWNNCMANLFSAYLEDNRYNIRQRTPIEGEKPADFKVWDTKTFVETILDYFNKSLSNKEILQKQKLTDYSDLLKTGTDPETYEPTLYDFLVRNMIAFLYHTPQGLPQPISSFRADQPEFLGDLTNFAALQITSPDPLLFTYLTLLQFQELTRFHLLNGNTKALANVTQERLTYVYENCGIADKESLMLNTLLRMADSWNRQPGYEDICFELAQRYHLWAGNYNPDTHPEGFDYELKALEWCQQAIQAAPQSTAAHNAQVLVAQIQRPEVNFYCDGHLLPDQPNLITYRYRNCTKLYCRAIPFKTHINVGKKNYADLIAKPYTKEWTVNTNSHNDYRLVTQPEVLPALPIGSYVILVSPTPFSSSYPEGISGKWVQVTDLAYSSRENDNDEYAEYIFYRRSTGEPLTRHNVTVGYKKYSGSKVISSTVYKTDERGIIRVPKHKDDYIECRLVDGKDALTACEYHWWGWRENKDKAHQKTAHIFTDRAIYRPGQTVHFKCILMESSYKENHTVADQEIEIILKDANWKDIDKQTLITNYYGSVSGEFTLPASALTGNFMIKCKGYGNCNFRVEEYKRPQFEVAVDKPKESYRIGDQVTISGSATAYAGYPIDGATVKYRVTRMASYPFWRWWWIDRPTSSSQEIAQGETTTDADGRFQFDFTALADKNDRADYFPVYHYQMNIAVTDLNGETHNINNTVCVGQKNLLLDLALPQQICADQTQPSYGLKVTNLSGVPQNVDVTYRIERLAMPSQFKHQRCYDARPDADLFDLQKVSQQLPYLELDNEAHPETWAATEEVCRVQMNTQDANDIEIPNLSHYKDGYYRLTLSAQDKDGQDVTTEKIFFVFHQKSKKCTAYKPVWLYCDKKTAEVGETVTFYVGSYLDNAHILLEVSANDTLLKSEWLKLQRGVNQFTLPIKEEYRGTIHLRAVTCQQGFNYMEDLSINVPFTNKKIEATFETFRDLAYPGAKEEWRITLKGKDGEKVAAELLCAMYDASLDAFATNSFQLPVDYLSYCYDFPYFRFYKYDYNRSGYNSFKTFDKYKSHLYAQYKTGLSPYIIGIYYSAPRRAMAKGNVALSADFEEDAVEIVESAEQEEVVLNIVEDNIKVSTDIEIGGLADETTAAGTASTTETVPVQVRSNFAETAFFYPHLYTNKDGDVVISCTLPESLTQWKMLGLAHTPDLKTGIFEKLLRTRKELMVVPNAPRFFREGDTLWFTAKIVNMDDDGQPLTGTAHLTLTDAVTGQPLDIIANGTSQPFSTTKDESALVRFQLHIPQQISAITYRITATCNEQPFSDGQEATLPVLTNRMLVTETLPFYINGGQEKTITFNALEEACKQMSQPDNTLTHHKLTVEFTPNPIWLAIGSLSYMTEYPYECSEQLFSRIYGNAIAAHIANSSPAIKQMIESWKNSSPDDFRSKLEKNEELRNIVLEETPWVMEAQNESENMQRLCQLFDTKHLQQEMQKNIDKLQKNQNASGAWPWFAGGMNSQFITQHIVAGIGHLKALGINADILKSNSLRKAINYLDNEVNKQYQEMKKHGLSNNIYSFDLHYLYARSFFLKAHPVSSSCTEAYQYYLGLARRNYEKMSFYDQALTALILYRNNEQTLARKVIAHLKEYAQHSDEMGMWWKKEGWGFCWNEAPIERQALLIEAFNTITNDQESVEQMQTWLLKQKQTQNWGTTKATAEACYALLLNNMGALDQESSESTQRSTVVVGGQDLRSSASTETAATGYCKASWNSQEISGEMAHILVSKPTKGIAWGGAYWQYFENLDKIKQDNDLPHPLSIRKQLYKVVLGERGETLQPITEQSPLKVGDQVRVRIELRSDRDMEFVHLKDMRGAGFELKNTMSGYRHQDGLFYYEAPRDASVNFFFDRLPKGTYVFEYTLFAEQSGTFSNGISTVQCMYAPEFADHSQGITVKIGE